MLKKRLVSLKNVFLDPIVLFDHYENWLQRSGALPGGLGYMPKNPEHSKIKIIDAINAAAPTATLTFHGLGHMPAQLRPLSARP